MLTASITFPVSSFNPMGGLPYNHPSLLQTPLRVPMLLPLQPAMPCTGRLQDTGKEGVVHTLGFFRTSAMMALMLSDGWACGWDVGIIDATVAQGACGSAHAWPPAVAKCVQLQTPRTTHKQVRAILMPNYPRIPTKVGGRRSFHYRVRGIAHPSCKGWRRATSRGRRPGGSMRRPCRSRTARCGACGTSAGGSPRSGASGRPRWAPCGPGSWTARPSRRPASPPRTQSGRAAPASTQPVPGQMGNLSTPADSTAPHAAALGAGYFSSSGCRLQCYWIDSALLSKKNRGQILPAAAI